MLLLSTRSLTIDGVTVFPDHADPQQFWYLAAPVTLAKLPDSDEPQFSLIMYAPDLASSGVKGVGFLNVTLALKISEDTSNGIKSQIKRQFGVDEPRLAPVPYDEGTVQIVTLDMQGSGGTVNAAPPGAFVAVQKILGATSPSLYGDNNALFALTLSEEGATILKAAFDNGLAPVGAIYNLKFTGVRPALDVKITADLKRVYESFSAGLSAEVYWVSAGIDATFEKLRQDGAIKIEIVNLAGDAASANAEQQALAIFKDQILAQWFVPSLSPTTAQAADVGVPALPQQAAAAKAIGAVAQPAMGGSMGGVMNNATRGAAVGAMSGAMSGMNAQPGPAPAPGMAAPQPMNAMQPAASVPQAGMTTPPRPPTAMPTPAQPAGMPAAAGHIPGAMPTPAPPPGAMIGQPSPPAQPAMGGPAGPPNQPVNAGMPAGAMPAGGMPAVGGMPTAGANAPAAPRPPTPGGMPTGGGMPAMPSGGMPAGGAAVPLASAASGAASAASPFGVALRLRYVHQDEQKTVTYEYNRMDAVQRTYAPQGYFGLLLDKVDRAKHFLEVDGTDPFFNHFAVKIEPPHDFAGIGLQSAHVAIDYGDADRSGPSKHGEFVFDSPQTGPQTWEVYQGFIQSTSYRYAVDYTFDPASGWAGEKSRYTFPVVTTENRQLTLDPRDVLGFLNINVTGGHVDPELVDRIDVSLHYRSKSGWSNDALVTLRPGGPAQSWKLRLSDKTDNTYTYTTKCTLKDGRLFDAGPFTSTASAIVVNDPFSGAINITIQPAIDPAKTKLAIVEISYRDPTCDYDFETTLQVPPESQPRQVHIPVLDRAKNAYQYRITTISTTNQRSQGNYLVAQDPLVFVGDAP